MTQSKAKDRLRVTIHIGDFALLAKVLKAVNYGEPVSLNPDERDIVARSWMMFDDAAKRRP